MFDTLQQWQLFGRYFECDELCHLLVMSSEILRDYELLCYLLSNFGALLTKLNEIFGRKMDQKFKKLSTNYGP